MSNPEVFILHCSVNASVRQSVQIAFEDYKLPPSVIDTLKRANALSIRPNLSSALKTYLDELRLLQKYLYRDCTISHGDVHFLHPDYFEDAMHRIDEIRAKAADFNSSLKELWSEEFGKWQATIDDFFSPLFHDQQELAMVREAYMKIFPTVKEFSSPINVCVVGPYPASLERVDDPNDLASQMQEQAAINTSEVLKAAQDGALDSSLAKVAELLDDLDVRPASKVGERVLSNNPKRRGTWQYIYSHLQLASKHCPSLNGITSLLQDLIRVGETMRDAPKGVERMNAFRRYSEIRQEIRDEATAIVKGKDSSKGFEALQMSLTLSNSYETLLQAIPNCKSLDDLQALETEIEAQTGVYKHRAKHLSQVFGKTKELLVGASFMDSIAEELKETKIKSTEDCDF